MMLMNPRTLLLIDAVGAAMTSVATFYLLAGKRIETGMPIGLLYAMAFVAASFACFDIIAFVVKRIDPAIPLRMIACANFSYCIFVILSVCAHRTTVNYLGVVYFCIEVPIVVSLAILEWKVASRKALP